MEMGAYVGHHPQAPPPGLRNRGTHGQHRHHRFRLLKY